MNKLLSIVLITICINTFYGQFFNWTEYAGGTMIGEGTTSDIWGNTYTIGTFSTHVDFTDTTIIYTAPSYGSRVFITKYNKNGDRLWFKTYSGTSNCLGFNIETDSQGYIYIMASPTTGVMSLTSSIQMIDLFLAKLTPTGDLLWAKSISAATGFKSSLEVDDQGNCYTIFTSNNSGNFGSIYLDNSNAGNDVGIGKFDSNGNALWAKIITNPNLTSGQQGFDIAINNLGDLAIAGKYNAEIINPLTGNSISTFGSTSGSGFCYLSSILIDDFGNYVVGGTFNGTINFGNTTLNSMGSTEIFLASYNSSGNENWVKRVKNIGINSQNFTVSKIESDGDGNYFVCGRFPEISIFNNDTITAGGIMDSFIAKYDKDGNYHWVNKMGGIYTSDDYIQDIDVTNEGIISITGKFRTNGVFGGDTLTNLSPSHYFVSKVIGNNNLIKGLTYFDNNNNGIKESSEDIAPNSYIQIQPNSYSTFSSVNGDYILLTDTGSYTISTTPPQYHTVSPQSYVVNFNGYSMQDSVKNFGFVQIPNITDVQVELVGLTPVRPGFNTAYQITYKNIGTNTVSGSVNLKINQLLEYDSSSVNLNFQSIDSLSWSYNNLTPHESATINVYFTVNSFTSLGTINTIVANVTPLISDTVPINNIDTLRQVVVGSYDPNDKSVIPENDVLLNYVQDEKPFEYLVRFQNTGTDTAFTVIIVDTISSLLNLSSLEIIANSHNYRIELQDDRRIEFIFENINLPDSGANYIESNGYIKYKIKPHSTINVGQKILNTAFIYFDYNLPIITNTTTTNVYIVSDIDEEHKSWINFQVYPNPANHFLNYTSKIKESEVVTINLIDLNGRVLKTCKGRSESGKIDLENTPNGVYLIQFVYKSFKVNKKLIIK